MGRNLELKSTLEDKAAAVERVQKLGAVDLGEMRQVDTYFGVPRGRLKIRETDSGSSELIFYERRDEGPSRWSEFSTALVSDLTSTKVLLAAALGVRGTVTKRRRAFLWNECRIHIDEVEELGSFIEFEVMSAGDEVDDQARLKRLIEAFGLEPARDVYGSYIDLMER